MEWPWVSREHHREVIAAKDALIAMLEAQNAILAVRLEEPIKVSVNMPDDLMMMQPAVVRRRRQDQDEKPVQKPIDWGNLDENDPAVLAKLAADELGRPVTPYILSQTIGRIKAQIRTAKIERKRNSGEKGQAGTISRSALTEMEAVAQGAEYVPADIRKLVESAERG